MEDADPPIPELPEGGLVTDLAVLLTLANRDFAPGEPPIDPNAHCCGASASLSLRA